MGDKNHRRKGGSPAPEGRPRRAAAFRKSVRKKKRQRRLEGLLSAALAFVAGFSAVMCLSVAWRSVRTARLNRELSRLHEAYSAQEAPEAAQEPDAAPAFTPEAAAGPGENASDAAPDFAALPAEAPEAAMERETTPAAPAPQLTKTTVYHRDTGEALPEMARLREENRDLVGWLTIDGVLDLPVVYRANSYYLTHDFSGEKNAAGTIFLDVDHRFSARACNLLLHGHNMKDGSMFGHLIRYTDLDYLKRHPVIEFSTLWQKERYVIIAVMRVSLDSRDASFFNYFSYPAFAGDDEYRRYVRGAQLASLFAIPVVAEPSDALLTLSTCIDDDRLVILARRFHGEETAKEMRRLVSASAWQ